MEIDINGLLGLPNMEVISFSFTERTVSVRLSRVTRSECCPVCGIVCGRVRSYTERVVRDLDILGRKTYLTIVSRQFECLDCPRYFTEDIQIVRGNSGRTIRYDDYLYKMISCSTIQQVSLKEDVCWATLNDIYKKYSDAAIAARSVNWSSVKRISIDEIAVRKGKKNYACVLQDADTGAVLAFLEQRDMATLKAYFTAKGSAFCAQIEEVVSDMWDGYVNLAGEKGVFPHAINVIDLFHFVQHLGRALDSERRTIRKEQATDDTFKNLRWALLKAAENCTAEDTEKLTVAFEKAPSLGKIYELRKELKSIFATHYTKEEGLAEIGKWEAKAKTIASKALHKFLVTVENWKDKVGNYFNNRATNATMEGTNNHIRSIIRRAFGYIDFLTLRRRVLTECGNCP